MAAEDLCTTLHIAIGFQVGLTLMECYMQLRQAGFHSVPVPEVSPWRSDTMQLSSCSHVTATMPNWHTAVACTDYGTSWPSHEVSLQAAAMSNS